MMSSLLYALGRTAFRARRAVAAAWVAVLVLAGAAAGLLSTGTDNSFAIPGTPAQVALDALGSRFPEAGGAQAQVVVVAPAGQRITDPRIRTAVGDAVERLQDVDVVAAVVDPYAQGVTGALSRDGRAAIVTAQLRSASTEVTDGERDALVAAAEPARAAGATVRFGGPVFSSTGPALSPTEAVGVVVALVVLLVMFGSLRAAMLPVLTAILGVAVTMALILALSAVVPVSSTVPLLALMIGLAVGIDYALFILSRHRDQLAEGAEPEESAARAIATAGSAVVFAGLTVVIALAGLAVARIPFLTTMGLAAAGAVAIAVLVALTLVPAVLGFSGERLRPRPRSRAHRRPLPGLRPRRGARRPRARPAQRWVDAVTRRPLVTILLVVLALGALTIPAKDLRLALPDNGSAPVESTQRQAFDLVAEHFGPGYNAPLLVTADIIRTTDPVGVVNRIAAELRARPGVADVTTATPNRTADTGIIALVPEGSATSEATKDLVAQVRALAPHFERQYGVRTAVTGQTALAIDVSDRLGGALLPFGVLVVGLSLLLLGLVFRSVAVPVKASIGYLLSVGTAFGVVAAVFENGWLAGPLGVDRTGPVISFMPILLMGVLFGLAMDYEVFLVSRMREEYVRTRDPARALRVGFVGGARVVTAAALIMVAVFAAFVPEGDANIKPIALALAVGVLVDAFVVRMVLVPAVLALLGHAAWWLPGRLDRRLPVIDIEGETLRHEMELADWPAPGSPEVVHAEGLGLAGPRGWVFRDVDLAVRPGTVVAVHGGPGSGKTALLLALAGRMPITAGRARVAGEILPGSGRAQRAVRARTALAETAGINDLEESLTVEEHVAERIATGSLRPWVPRAAVRRVLDQVDEAFAAAGRTPTLGRRTLVADLPPLERAVLGLVLAMIGSPRLVMVDDVDRLRIPADVDTFWQALARLADRPAAGGRVSVIATCADPAPAVAAVPAGRLLLLDLTAAPLIPEKVR